MYSSEAQDEVFCLLFFGSCLYLLSSPQAPPSPPDSGQHVKKKSPLLNMKAAPYLMYEGFSSIYFKHTRIIASCQRWVVTMHVNMSSYRAMDNKYF